MRINYIEGQAIQISLDEGNGMFVQNGGSVEESIFIERKNGKLIVTGPMNCNSSSIEYTIKGWNYTTKKKDA